MRDPRRTVLLVEDEVSFARALADILEQNGLSVTLAHDEGMALSCLRQRDFDLLLLDLMLPPDLDAEPSDWGYRTGMRIMEKAQELKGRMPVVVLSAMRDQGVMEQAEACGVVSYIPKPASVDQILRVVSQAMAATRKDDSSVP